MGIKNEFVRDTGNSGLAAGDINGDGLVDLFVCGMEKANALYLNRGNWKFEDITENAGVACRGWRLSGALFSDTDADGDLDVLSTAWHKGKIAWFENTLFTCTPGFTGVDCNQCLSAHANGALCDTCDEGWGGLYCNICVAENGCQ